MKWLTFVSILALTIHQNVFCVNTRFQERYSWRVLNFQFPDDRTRQSLINSREYVPIANVPLGTEIWRDRFFVTIPRWLPGIASTLNYFRINGQSGPSPTLIPYPNYEMNRVNPNQTSFENNIVSVFRLKVDPCDRLWFVDTGIFDFAGTTRQVTPPRLFIIDLRTDRIIRRYTFGSSDATADSVFGGNIEVDVTADSCERAFAYLPDFGAYRLVVYSYEQNQSWRIKHPYFYFDPFASPFYIGGITFLWTDGMFGAALSPVQNDGFRTLYFSSISTNYQYAVSTRYLRDRSLATNTTTLLQAYRLLGTRGANMQTTAHALDTRTGTLFYTLANRNGIGCWNTFRFPNNYSPETNFVLATDDVTMIFPNDIIFDDSDNIWLLTDRLPVSNVRGLSENEVNFRLFTAPIRDVIRGTVCENINGNNANSGNTGVNNFNSGGSNSNFGGNNQNFGSNSNSGGNGQNFGSNNQNFGGSNQNSGGSSQSSGGSSQISGGSNQNFGGNNQNFGGNGQNFGGNGQNFGGNGQNSGGNNQNFGVSNQNFGASNQNSGLNSNLGGNDQLGGSLATGDNSNVNFPNPNSFQALNSGLRMDNSTKKSPTGNRGSPSNTNSKRPN